MREKWSQNDVEVAAPEPSRSMARNMSVALETLLPNILLFFMLRMKTLPIRSIIFSCASVSCGKKSGKKTGKVCAWGGGYHEGNAATHSSSASANGRATDG